MSRSRRRTPKIGWTTAESEKADKVKAHRSFRRAVRQRLRADPETDILPAWKERSDPLLWSKDGKQTVDPERFPRAMRK